MVRRVQPILEPGMTIFRGAVVPIHIEEMAGLIGIGMTEKQQRMVGDCMVRGYNMGMELPAEFDVTASSENPDSLILIRTQAGG